MVATPNNRKRRGRRNPEEEETGAHPKSICWSEQANAPPHGLLVAFIAAAAAMTLAVAGAAIWGASPQSAEGSPAGAILANPDGGMVLLVGYQRGQYQAVPP